jgi:hypothetical protein
MRELGRSPYETQEQHQTIKRYEKGAGHSQNS